MLRYTGCGLDNVFLRNGFEFFEHAGRKCVRIDDLDGLHRAIAMVVVDSPSPLDAQTFRFLRKEQDMSQRQLAGILGVDEQTVSLWERARNPIPQSADLVLRTLAKERCSGNAELVRVIERLNSLDRENEGRKIELAKGNGGWDQARAA